jgi:hypothetical protein
MTGYRDITRVVEEDAFALANEALRPEQFFAPPATPAQAQRRLMAAVLHDAIKCFQDHLFASGPRGRRLHRQAETWLWSRSVAWPFAYERICETLDLDPDALRLRLWRWRLREQRRRARRRAS